MEDLTKKVYKIKIDNKEREIIIEDFLTFLNLENEDYEKALLLDYYNNIPIKEFIYALITLVKTNQEFLNLLSDKAHLRILELERMQLVDYEALGTFLESTDPYLGSYQINSKLEQELDKLIAKTDDVFYKFFLVYQELCLRFCYDEKYFLSENEVIEQHENINYLSEINFEKNKVVCYEVTLILAYYLRKLGFNYEIIGEKKYGKHNFIAFRYQDFLIKVEPISTVLINDLVNIKLGNNIVGLTCYNRNIKTRDRFQELLNQYYKRKEMDVYEGMLPANKMRYSKDISKGLKKALILIDLAILKVKEANLDVIDMMSYLVYLLGIYRYESPVLVFQYDIIKDKKSPFGFSILITLSDRLYGTCYVLYNFLDIHILSQEETQAFFDQNIFTDITSHKRHILGIER